VTAYVTGNQIFGEIEDALEKFSEASRLRNVEVVENVAVGLLSVP